MNKNTFFVIQRDGKYNLFKTLFVLLIREVLLFYYMYYLRLCDKLFKDRQNTY